MNNCVCCGNQIYVISVGTVNSYWLLGKKYVYNICPRCQNKPFRKALFLNQKQDLPKELIKKFGKSLGYTNGEIKND